MLRQIFSMFVAPFWFRLPRLPCYKMASKTSKPLHLANTLMKCTKYTEVKLGRFDFALRASLAAALPVAIISCLVSTSVAEA